MEKKLKKIMNAKDYYLNHNESITEVSEKFNIDRNALGKTIKKDYDKYIKIENEDPNYYYYFSKEEKEMVDFFVNNPEINIQELKRIYNSNIKPKTLINWIGILGYEYHPWRKYSNNKNAFNEINTEEDAYWLGFLTADGYLNEKNNIISLGLGEIDLPHLQKFVKYMGFSEEEMHQLIKQGYGGAYDGQNIVYSATICGKQIVNNLKQYGLFQAKSGKEQYYHFSDEKFQIAYIRGLFDGDGYIRSTQYGVGLVGSIQLLTEVRNFICEKLNIKNYENKYIHKHGKIYKLAFGGKNISTKIIQLLYNNSTIHLDRKYKLYETYCRE